MPEGIELKRVEGKDISAVKGIADSRLHEEYSADLFKFFFEKHPDCFLVAEGEDGIEGFIVCVPVDGHTLRILMLAVKIDKQMKGIGSTLLEAALNHARGRMMTSVVLEVGTSNTEAIDFYYRKGFKVTGILPKYYRDRSDAYMMKRYIVM
jgi:ribosomal-protein-alanine acetyltransferase